MQRTPLDVALHFLAARPRSAREIRQRLRRAGVEDAEQQRVLTQLEQHGLVDDAAFARYWVEQRQTFKPRGQRVLQAELRQRGVAQPLAEEAASAGAAEAESDAMRAASRRARQLGNLDERTFRARMGQFLARRGFEWEVIAPTVERLWRDQQLNTS